MKTVGIVAEYNPFHNGHGEHMRRALAAAGAEAAVCVLSGDFVQRGEPAVFSKFARAESAVRCGASLVLELPLPWCLSSAEGFARGAVGLLAAAGVVDALSFGSECGDLASLSALAEALADPAADAAVRRELGAGVSYASARERALAGLVGPEKAALLRAPNDILGVEYVKAARALAWDAEICPLRRADSRHDGPGSASRLRAVLARGESAAPFVPPEALAVYDRERERGRGPVTAAALEQGALARLRMLPESAFRELPDAAEGLENRLIRAAREAPDWESAAAACKSKRYALSRLRRMLWAAALGLRRGMADGTPPFLRVLAADEKGRALLRRMRTDAALPVVSRSAAARRLTGRAGELYALTAAAHDFYALGYTDREQRRGGADWRAAPFLLPENGR